MPEGDIPNSPIRALKLGLGTIRAWRRICGRNTSSISNASRLRWTRVNRDEGDVFSTSPRLRRVDTLVVFQWRTRDALDGRINLLIYQGSEEALVEIES